MATTRLPNNHSVKSFETNIFILKETENWFWFSRVLERVKKVFFLSFLLNPTRLRITTKSVWDIEGWISRKEDCVHLQNSQKPSADSKLSSTAQLLGTRGAVLHHSAKTVLCFSHQSYQSIRAQKENLPRVPSTIILVIL